jgi:hypothetical protein
MVRAARGRDEPQMPGGGRCKCCLAVSHRNEVAIAVVCAPSRWDSAGRQSAAS